MTMTRRAILLTALVVLAAPLVLILGGVVWLSQSQSQRGAPSAEARDNFRAFEVAGLGPEPFTIAALKAGEWKFVCVGGEYRSDFDTIAQPYATEHGYAAKAVDDFKGDIVEASPWAITMFDANGDHFTWQMNERLLRYRRAEDQAYGWCFEADEKIRLIDGRFLDLPGRDDSEVRSENGA